jgi:hypothetical protein
LPLTGRASLEGFTYHVLNRGNARSQVFHKDDDYGAFLGMMARRQDVKSMVNHQPRESLPQVDHSSFGHPSVREFQFREAGQASDILASCELIESSSPLLTRSRSARAGAVRAYERSSDEL